MSYVTGKNKGDYDSLERLAKPSLYRSIFGNGGSGGVATSLWRSIPDNVYEIEPFGHGSDCTLVWLVIIIAALYFLCTHHKNS